MDGIKVLRNIKPNYNKGLILTRLGYDKYRTELEGEAKTDFERVLSRTENVLDITCAYRITGISKIESPQVFLEDGTILKGIKLSELLSNCDQALLMMASGGKKVMELICKLQKEGLMSEAVVVDAAASEITDSALNVVMSQVEQQLRSKGMTMTKMRFSPGYGDFDITQQRDFYRLLEGERFGIKLNDACLLIPEKSVFAIAGIGGI
jgi:hypothetical protein